MESYELKKPAASEELESHEKAEIGEIDGATTLGAFNEEIDFLANAVIAEEKSMGGNLPLSESPDILDLEISSETESKIEQIFQLSPEVDLSSPEKVPSQTDNLESETAAEPLSNITPQGDISASLAIPDITHSEGSEAANKPLNKGKTKASAKSETSEVAVNLDDLKNDELPEADSSILPASETIPETKKRTAKSKKATEKETDLPVDEEKSVKGISVGNSEAKPVVDRSPVEDEISQVTDEKEEELTDGPKNDLIDEEDDLLSEEEPDVIIVPVHDYSSYSKVQLVNTLRKMMEDSTVEEVRPHAEAIKACFYKLRNAEIYELKQAFIAAGNEEVLFESEPDPFEIELKDLLKEYKNLRAEINRKQEAVKEENYQKKLVIIDEIKSLINSEESLNVTFQEFNELQDKWRRIGLVPQSKVKDLWENYHYHVELFYDFVKINRELRDLDLRRNMDIKMDLCKKAEELSANNADALSTFRDLQKLHELWREIGPVPRENKQELWERFKVATSLINKRYQQFFEQERSTQREQLQKKMELCELAEQYAGFVSENPREWNDITDKVIALQEEWKKSGYGPRKENAKIWERFRAANDAFFQSKRNFWNKSKDHLNKNLAMKLEICDQAERLKDSEDWKATTDKLITLQKKWKEVGPVPRKQSELVWKRFRTACDDFFNRKTHHFSGITDDQDENYKAKKELIAEIEDFKPSVNTKENIEALKKFQDRWAEIGFVPFRKKEELQMRYHNLIEAQFDKLKLDDQDVVMYKFKSKIEHLASVPGGWGKINIERDRCSQHLKQLESDINTLANNVGFFGSSKGAQSLIQGVNAQIEKIKSQIDYLKAKIKIIDQQDELN